MAGHRKLRWRLMKGQRNQMVIQYLMGDPIANLAKVYRVSKSYVVMAARRLGAPRRYRER